MSKIRILSEQEIKSIAAGEVIESPANIIKELIENSIDAESTNIVVMYQNGGMDNITITDNGNGILKEDLPKALKPHATSKLEDINDLYFKNNLFFGFRGEALSSIAGISNFKIISKDKNSEDGYSIISHHGIISNIAKEAANIGTTIIIKELFDNVPARKKYLENTKNIAKKIQYTIKGLALAHPKITFHIYKDNQIENIYEKKLSNLTRMYQLANQSPENYLIIQYADIYLNLEGIISKSEYGCYDKNKIFILVNNRLIKQQNIISKCIKPYYSENFIKRYPELYLQITVPPDQIDINVHPRKEEVLFLYQHKIEQILEKVIRQTLEERSKKIFELKEPSESLKIESQKIISSKSEKSLSKPHPSQLIQKNETELLNQQKISSISAVPFQNKIIPENIKKQDYSDQKDIILKEKFTSREESKTSASMVFQSKIFNQEPLFELSTEEEKKFIGILDNTYILLLTQKSIICIDQHALHEKILYEKYKKQYTNQPILSHKLLFNNKHKTTEEEYEILKNYKNLFESCGIFYELESLHITFKSLPSIFNNQNNPIIELSKYIQMIKENKNISENKLKELFIHEIAAMQGCKNAIKGGDKISEQEIKLLLSQTKNINEITFCPHGRPIYYQITSDLLATLCKRK